MKKAGLVLALLAALAMATLPAAASAARKKGVTPKTGRWSGKINDSRFIELTVRRAKNGNRRISLWRLSHPPCLTTPVGEFIGQSSKSRLVKVSKRRKRRARIVPGAFGTFFTVSGDRNVRVLRKDSYFSTSRKGKITIRITGDDDRNCPNTTTFKIKRGALNTPGPTPIP